MADDEVLEAKVDLRAGRVSWSQMSTADICGWKFALTYEQHAPRESSGALVGGLAAHDTVERGERRWPDIRSADLYPLFEEFFEERVAKAGGHDAIVWGANGKEDAAWWLERGPEMIDVWWTLRQQDEENGLDVIAIEAEIGFHVAGVYFTGYIDRLDRLPSGHHRVTDWKTGRQNGQRYQAVLYGIGVEQVFDLPVDFGRIVNIRTGKVDEFELSPYREATEFLVEKHMEFVDSGIRRPNPSNLCLSCGVWHACKWGSAVVEQRLLQGDE